MIIYFLIIYIIKRMRRSLNVIWFSLYSKSTQSVFFDKNLFFQFTDWLCILMKKFCPKAKYIFNLQFDLFSVDLLNKFYFFAKSKRIKLFCKK